jgi:hypothetical protein
MVTFWEPSNERDYRSGHISNLSASGAFVVTEAPFAPPVQLNMRTIVGEETLDIQAEVVRSLGETHFHQKQLPGAGMGLRFLEPSSESVRLLIGELA